MRRFLMAATATAPLVLAPWSMPVATANAATTVTSGRTTPIATATANNGSADDVDVASGGAISGTGTTPAVTLNSNNNVTLEGSITSTDVSGATGVLLNGGNAGSFTSTGSISVTESFTATDSANSDGVIEAPFAQGSARYGVRLIGASPLTGAVTIGGTGVTVKGDNSYGVSLEAPVTGALTVTAPVALTGSGGAAVQETGGVGGNVAISGAISATGQGSSAVVLGGPVGGAVTVSSALTSTGYSATTRSTTDTTLTKIQATTADVQQGGSALVIGGSVANGVFLAAPPAGTVSGSTADLDGDGVADGAQTPGSLITYGSAPALVIGGAGAATAIGLYGAGQNAFGVILRGTVNGQGVYDGVTATAAQLGAAGGRLTIQGGVRVVGAATASAYEAAATGLHVLTGTSTPLLQVEGSIGSAILHSTLVTTPTVATSTAVLIDAGANLPALNNLGSIAATANGDALSTGAVIDRSGTLATITNQGVISAVVTPLVKTDAVSGSAIAIDLRANTTGVTLIQSLNPNPTTTYGSTSGTTATATSNNAIVTPLITGDVLLGSGPNSVQLLSGSITGALDLGSNTASFTIDNGAAYGGALSYSGPALALNVVAGSLTDTNPATLRLSSLNVGATGALNLAVDPQAGRATSLVVTGPATLAAGAKIGVTLLSEVTGAQTYVLVSSPNLSNGAADTSLLGSVSYLYDGALTTNAAAGVINLAIRQRSAAELGLSTAEGQGLAGVLTGVQANASIERALLAPTDKTGFLKVYDQLLPDHGGGVFVAAQQASDAIGRNTTDHLDTPESGPSAWGKEFTLGALVDKGQGDAAHAGGFGFVGGASTGQGRFGALGVTAAFVDATVTDPQLSDNSYSSFSELETGLYWTGEVGGLRLAARGAGGYLWGVTRRQLNVAATQSNDALALQSKATWHGWTASGQLYAAYQIDFGRLFVRPQAHVDYFTLQQDAYTDVGGGAGFDLSVQGRNGSESSASGSVVFGAKFGSGLVWQPSLEIGARDVFQGDAGATTAGFTGVAGSSFTLSPNKLDGAGGLARLSLKAIGEFYELELDAQGQEFAHYSEGDVGVTVRARF